MKSKTGRWIRIVSMVLPLAALMATPGTITVLGGGNSNPRVLPPNSKPYGMTYGEWSARWWQWALSIPIPDNPLFDETGAICENGQSGHVWFLAGVANVSGTAVRTECMAPAGKALFFPILNVECSTVEPPPFFGSNEAELRACAEGFLNDTAGLACEIDGVSIQNLQAYRAGSPLFDFTIPDNNILGLAAGSGQAVADGVYLMLAPLSVGQHTIHFTGTFVSFGFTLDITYHLSVVPHHG